MPANDTSAELKAEAETVLRKLHLPATLSRHGQARVVGSVALDLLVRRDIDVHLLISSNDVMGVCDQVYRQLLRQADIHEVRISDHRDRGGVKIGIDAYPGGAGVWAIDIWITDRPETTGFALVERLNRELKGEHRQAILAIKRHYHAEGKLRDGLSAQIYEAVANHGVRTVDDFERFLARAAGKAGLI